MLPTDSAATIVSLIFYFFFNSIKKKKKKINHSFTKLYQKLSTQHGQPSQFTIQEVKSSKLEGDWHHHDLKTCTANKTLARNVIRT